MKTPSESLLNVARYLVCLARQAKDHPDRSLVDLLAASPYLEVLGEVSVDLLREALAQAPNCAREWIHYSEDKRSGFGWYLSRIDTGAFEVGFLDSKADTFHVRGYDDLLDACACFLHRELRELLNLGEHQVPPPRG